MPSNFADILAQYHKKYARLLQNSEPNSDEHYAYSHIMQAFNQNQGAPPNQRVISIPAALAEFSRALSTLQARAIVRDCALDFLRDTEQPPHIYGL